MPTTAKGTPYVVSTDLVANYPTVSSDLADHIDDNLQYNAQDINAQTGSGANAYTFALADASLNKLVTATNAAAATYTVPPQSSITWASGAVLRILNEGAGIVTLAGGSGVTLNGSVFTLNQYQYAEIHRTASNTWTVVRSNNPGKILQVVRDTDTTDRTTTSTSYVDVTGLSVSITPTLSTSNIMIVCSYLMETDGAGTGGSLAISNASNTVISGAEDGLHFVTSGGQYLTSPHVMIAWDSPATTSATTYKARFKRTIGSGTIIMRNSTTTAQLFAIEVAA